jgi:site-specific DNA-adenine methylase
MTRSGIGSETLEGSRPVLRWAGSKQALAPTLTSLLPAAWNTYFEPMVGGGSMFFPLRPERSVLSDTNDELHYYYRVFTHERAHGVETQRADLRRHQRAIVRSDAQPRSGLGVYQSVRQHNKGEVTVSIYRAHRYGADHAALKDHDLDPERFANLNRLHGLM